MAHFKCWTIVAGCSAIVLLMVGCFSVPLLKRIINATVAKDSVILSANSALYGKWINPPMVIYMKYHVFNITNPNEILIGKRPVLHEIGPYVYIETRVKTNVVFDDTGMSVTWFERKRFHFDSVKSGGLKESDMICSVNIPLQGMNAVAKSNALDNVLLGLLSEYLPGFSFFIRRPVHDVLWGYNDTVLTMLCTALPSECKKYGISTMAPLQLNNTHWGPTITRTGKDDLPNVFSYIKWNGTDDLGFWSSKQCNMINGTDGTMFHPNVKKEDILPVFISDIWRSAYIHYVGPSSLKDIPLFRFEMLPSSLENTTEYPFNSCFNNFGPSGVLNLTAVSNVKGVPLFASQPHFFGGSPVYNDALDGLVTPDASRDTTALDIEPYTGMVFNVTKQLQINVYIEPMVWNSKTEKVSRVLMPLFFAAEVAVLDDKDIEEFKSEITRALKIANDLFVTGLVLGLLFTFLCVFFLIRMRHENRMRKTAAKLWQLDHNTNLDPTDQTALFDKNYESFGDK